MPRRRTFFAEKLETVIHCGSFNSHMKDFHDLYSMISSKPFLVKIEEIIRMVFEHRETTFALPITYDKDELNRLQNFWNEYLRNLRAENSASLPEKIADVISKVNNWLQSNTGIK